MTMEGRGTKCDPWGNTENSCNEQMMRLGHVIRISTGPACIYIYTYTSGRYNTFGI